MKKIILFVAMGFVLMALSLNTLRREDSLEENNLIRGALLNDEDSAETFEANEPPEENQQNLIAYFSMAKDGSSTCAFGDFTGCRLFSFDFAEQQLTEVLPDKSIVLPAISPDGDQIVFRAGASASDLETMHIYSYDLFTGNVEALSDDLSWNGQGHWPFWLSNTEILFSNTNDCSASTTGCSKSSLYEDLYKVTLKETEIDLQNSGIYLGAETVLSGLQSEACSFSNPVVNPSNPNLIGFHVSPVDGTGKVQDGSCPFVTGLGGQARSNSAQPVPIVLDLSKALKKSSISDLSSGVDFFKFDLESAGIDGCAHMDITDSGMVTCIEQGTQSADKLCSNPSFSTSECVKKGYSLMNRNKLFGFVEKNGVYTNLRSQGEALFEHLHPSELPGSDAYWNEEQSCQLYATKYAHSCGEDALLATVQCTTSDSGEKSGFKFVFSRLMQIDYSNPNEPVYFDITGWAETEFPEKWSSGSATAFSGTCF